MISKDEIIKFLNAGCKIIFRGGEFYISGNLVDRLKTPDLWDNLFFSMFDPSAVWTVVSGIRTLEDFE